MKTKKKCKTKHNKAALNLDIAPEGQETMHLKPAEKTTTTANKQAEAKTASVVDQVSQLYSNLIAVRARQP